MNGSLLRKCGLFAGLLLSFFIANAQSGIKLKLQLMPDGQYWGVYAKPTDDLSPSFETLTGTGNVTIVMPLNYAWSSFKSVSGLWDGAFPSIVNGPVEAPTKSYVSFGFISDNPTIRYQNGAETLLFKFKKDNNCPDQLYLMGNDDPFMPPNSISSNPPNSISVFDFGDAFSLYQYVGNYAPYAWDCRDTDGDGHLNAHEDTNGNGIYDHGVDASNLNEDEAGYFGEMLYKLQLMPDGQTWGVYVKPAEGVFPHTGQTIVGSGQVTVVMPKNYAWSSLTSVNGTWAAYLPVDGPSENPTKRYMSFGFSNETNPIPFQSGMETLLFTFKGDGTCPEDIYLLDNQNDPFNHPLPNSEGNNPGNEITIFDIVNAEVYEYGGNYAPHAADCHDNDGDGLLNALEDTNGNGVFDPSDVSDLNSNLCGISFTAHPSNTMQCANGTASFTATAIPPAGTNANLAYQWQVSSDGNNFSNITAAGNNGYAGWNTQTLTVGNLSGTNGWRFRLAAKRANCTFVYSQAATLQVDGPLTITSQPLDFTNCADEEAYFYANVNTGVGYDVATYRQWQMSADNGATWTNITQLAYTISGNTINFAGYDSDSLLMAPIVGLNGYLFRCNFGTGNCSTVTTNSARLTVEGSISFTDHPDDVTPCTTEPVVFSVAVDNATSVGNIQYQWQRWTVSGWQNITDNATYDGATTNQLSITPPYSFPANSMFRCRVRTGECNWVESDQARIINGSLSVTAHPQDVITCAGDAVLFSATVVDATGVLSPSQINYQWLESSDGGATWVQLEDDTFHIGAREPFLSVAYSSSFDGNLYVLQTWSNNCDMLFSNPALLDYEGPMTVTDEPDHVAECAGNGTTFSAIVAIYNGDPNSLTYQWEVSKRSAAAPYTWEPFINITNGGVFSGATTNTLSISDVSGMYGWRFRMRFKSPTCDSQWTYYGQLNVEGPIEVTVHPTDVSANIGEEVFFTANSINHGANYPSNPNMTLTNHRWEVSSDGGATWSNIVLDGNHAGITGANLGFSNDGDTLAISDITGLNGNMYRIAYTTPTCSVPVYSDPATLTVEGSIITFQDQPDDVTICFGEPAQYSIVVSNANGQMNIQYQWQRWAPAGWIDLSNTAPFAGVFTNQLTITPPYVGLHNAKFRCRVKTANSNWHDSDIANLFIEGPISFDLQPTDLTICSNKPVQFNTAVTQPGFVPMTYRWHYKAPNGDWKPFPTNNGSLSALGILNPTDPGAAWHGSFGQDLDLTNVDGLDGYQFRLVVSTPNCSDASDEAILHVLDACQDEACDYDNDGILNEQDGDFNECGSACLKVKLQLLHDSSGWAVMAKPFGGWSPSASNMTHIGRINIMAPSSFDFQGINSVSGNWLATNLAENIPGHPGFKCMTFELWDTQGAPIPYQLGEATTLFTFDMVGPCPEKLYIVEGAMPGIEPNRLSGIDNGFAGGFDLCGVYARKAWRCHRPTGGGNGGPTIVVATDSLETDRPKAITDRDGSFAAGGTTLFSANPNPAADHVDINVSAALAEGQSKLYLFDLQGKKWRETAVNQAVTRMDLAGLPAGVYFVSLAQNGQPLQRIKLIKQ